MATLINTAKVKPRRQLRFNSLDEIAAEIERLAACGQVRAIGNWSSGQVIEHLAATMDNSIDGFPDFVPGPIKYLLRLFMRRRFITQPMPPGFKLPARAARMLPGETSWETALANFRRAMQRLRAESKRSPHPAFGPMSIDEWNQIHCRHCELHLSFLVPVEG